MRTLLRSLGTGNYLSSSRIWTPDIDAARDFESISEALAAVRQGHLRDMELVLTDAPACIGEVPVAKLTLRKFLAVERLGILKHRWSAN